MHVLFVKKSAVHGHGRSGADALAKALGIRHVHIVSHAVDGEKYAIDVRGQILENALVIKRIARDIIGFSFSLYDHADGVAVGMLREDGAKFYASFGPFRAAVEADVIVLNTAEQPSNLVPCVARCKHGNGRILTEIML